MQDFARTAAYFETRAAKVSGPKRRQQLELVARMYREKSGSGNDSPTQADGTVTLSRRERLAVMFRSYASPQVSKR
jgi:hypothetical protein